MSGGLIVLAAHGSHDSMWRSVPQMPVLRTRIRTSSMPIARLRDVAQLEAGAGAGLDEGEHGLVCRADLRAAIAALITSDRR